MLIKRKRHRVPALNTTATADISFMLLAFFLMTTSMDVDRGLVRQLPPADTQQPADAATDISRDNVMKLAIDSRSQTTLNGRPVAIASLRRTAARFIEQRRKQHVVYIDADPEASYDTYFQVENEIAAAYSDVRDRTARRMYGRPYAMLGDTQKQKVRQECPQHISETYKSAKDTEKEERQ